LQYFPTFYLIFNSSFKFLIFSFRFIHSFIHSFILYFFLLGKDSFLIQICEEFNIPFISKKDPNIILIQTALIFITLNRNEMKNIICNNINVFKYRFQECLNYEKQIINDDESGVISCL
jgi:hypothetical protein